MSGQRIMGLHRRLTPVALVLLTLLGAELIAAASASARRPGGHPTASPFQLFDANVGYTSGIFLPLATYTPASVRPFTTQTWSDAARPVSRVAADGATLLLIRAELPSGVGSATFSVRSEQLPAADPGSLWAVDDHGITDASSQGGIIDTHPPGPSTLTVSTVVVGSRTFALLLYRAPRNFDGGATGSLAGRTVSVLLV